MKVIPEILIFLMSSLLDFEKFFLSFNENNFCI